MLKHISNWLKADQRRAVALGNFIEYYDLFLFVHLGALISQYFMGNENAGNTLYLDILKFGGVYCIAPIAGLFFGLIGDRYGRRPVLIGTSIIVCLSTTALLLIPSYNTIGEWSLWLFFAVRVIQSIGMAGEPLAAKLYSTENFIKKDLDKHKSQFTTVVTWWIQVMGIAQDVASIFAMCIGILIAIYLPNNPEAIRIVFLISLLGSIFVIYLRRHLVETDEFKFYENKYLTNVRQRFKWGFIFKNRNFYLYTILCTYVGIIFSYNFFYLSPHIIKNTNLYEFSNTQLMIHNAIMLSITCLVGSIICRYVAVKNLDKKKTQLLMLAISAMSFISIDLLMKNNDNFYLYYYLLLLQAMAQMGCFWDLIYGHMLRTFPLPVRFKMQAGGEAVGRCISFVVITLILPKLCMDGLLLLTFFCLFYAFIAVCFFLSEDEMDRFYVKKFDDYLLKKHFGEV